MKKDGFSLIELAIWLTIISMIMASMLSWITPPTIDESKKLRITQSRLAEIENALENFRVIYGRLPCPALGTVPDSNSLAYEENCTGNGGFNVGVIPAKTLGIDRSLALDAWDRRFTYQVATSLCGVDAGGTTINCNVNTYSTGTGNISVTKATTAVPAQVTTTAAYALLSHGANGNRAYLANGQQRIINPGISNETENFSLDNVYWIDPVGSQLSTTGAYNPSYARFDDIVRFRTKQQLEYRVRDTSKIEIAYDPTSSANQLVYCFDNTGASNSVAEVLEGINSAANTAINNAFTTMPVNYFAPFNAADRIIGVLWQMQEVCAKYYPARYSTANVRRCTANRIYDSSLSACRCPTNISWNGTTCT